MKIVKPSNTCFIGYAQWTREREKLVEMGYKFIGIRTVNNREWAELERPSKKVA